MYGLAGVELPIVLTIHDITWRYHNFLIISCLVDIERRRHVLVSERRAATCSKHNVPTWCRSFVFSRLNENLVDSIGHSTVSTSLALSVQQRYFPSVWDNYLQRTEWLWLFFWADILRFNILNSFSDHVQDYFNAFITSQQCAMNVSLPRYYINMWSETALTNYPL